MDKVLEVADERFYALTVADAPLQTLYEGCRWAEGPVWFADAGYLVWSDIPNDRMLRWVPGLGVSEFRAPSQFVNGNFRDLQGRLVSCSHGARAVLRTEPDGAITVLAERHQGGRLNSPNDLVVKSDGSIWFTDPDYGILSDHEGHKAESEQTGCHVYRIDPGTGALGVVADDFVKPNGLCFSPDESLLYIADSGGSREDGGPHHIRVFSVGDDATLSGGDLFADINPGVPDGLRVDTRGNVWTSARDGVQCFDPDGTLLGKILTPQVVANLTFGGPDRTTLFLTANEALYSIEVAATGAQRP
jgi:gluconolactonase